MQNCAECAKETIGYDSPRPNPMNDNRSDPGPKVTPILCKPCYGKAYAEVYPAAEAPKLADK